MATPRICKVEGCGKARHAQGYCCSHYSRQRRHGDPLLGRKTYNGDPERFLREIVLTYEGDECLKWPFAHRGPGYGVLATDDGLRAINRVVCEETHGPPPTPDHEAAHSCGKGHEGCCTKKHLSWKTRSENEADKLIHGTSNRGERCGAAKLSEADVLAIRGLRGHCLQREIAERFGVDQSTVSLIHRRTRWSWL